MPGQGLSGFLQRLKKVKTGQPIEEGLTADLINSIIDAIASLARGDNITAGGTIYKGATQSSVSLFGRKQPDFGGGGGSRSSFPYQVTAVGAVAATEEEPNPPPRLIVELESWLMHGYLANDKTTVTGLGSAFNFEPDEEGKFYVWIQAAIDEEGDITGVTIEHGDEPWSDDTRKTTPTGSVAAAYPYPVAFSEGSVEEPGRPERAYMMLAHTEELGGGNEVYTKRLTIATQEGESVHTHQIIQNVRNDLILCEKCYEGKDCLMFFPYIAPCLHDPPA